MFERPKGIKCHGFPGPGDGSDHTYTMNPAKEFIEGHTDHVDKSFASWTQHNGKQYKNEQEALNRKDVYRQNMRFIHSKNRQHLSYTLASNHLADLTDSEMEFRRGKLKSTGNNGGLSFQYSQNELKSSPKSLGMVALPLFYFVHAKICNSPKTQFDHCNSRTIL